MRTLHDCGRYILSADGVPEPCEDLLTWGKWMQESTKRIVAKDSPLPGVRVSTVFLGLDHSFGSGPPLLYETMIFGGEHNDWQARYSTREEALAGHARAIRIATGEEIDDGQA